MKRTRQQYRHEKEEIMATADLTVELDDDLKKRSEALQDELGIDLTTAINVFLHKSIAVGGFPFDVRIEEPNKKTTLALHEAEKLAKAPGIKDLNAEDALKSLKK